ncbi:MAG: hypothetical protein AB7G75_16880 [Candidatus Binatia bacterium]
MRWLLANRVLKGMPPSTEDTGHPHGDWCGTVELAPADRGEKQPITGGPTRYPSQVQLGPPLANGRQ